MIEGIEKTCAARRAAIRSSERLGRLDLPPPGHRLRPSRSWVTSPAWTIAWLGGDELPGEIVNLNRDFAAAAWGHVAGQRGGATARESTDRCRSRRAGSGGASIQPPERDRKHPAREVGGASPTDDDKCVTDHRGTTERPSRPCGRRPRSARRSPGTADRADACRSAESADHPDVPAHRRPGG